jgi:tRNA-binding protein
MKSKPEITFEDFSKIDVRFGTVSDAMDFHEAHNSSNKLLINFGIDIGRKKSSAQITDLYSKEQLIGKQIMAVAYFSSRQIGPFMSEALVFGIVGDTRGVVLLKPDQNSINGLLLG